MGRDGDLAPSTVPGLCSEGSTRVASCDLGWWWELETPFPSIWGGQLEAPREGTACEQPTEEAAGDCSLQKALQAIVLINTILFPLWHPSPCLLCVNRVFSMM